MATYATAERTRKGLIEAAGELFARHGVDAVSTRAIAEKAGENVGSIHYHFGGKEGLLLATADFVASVWDDRPLEHWFAANEALLDSPTGQARLLAGFVSIYFDRLYSCERPWWACQLFHQVLTLESPAADLLIERIVDPHMVALLRFCERARPEMNLDQRRVWAVSFVSQVTYYALVQPTICKVFRIQQCTPELLDVARHRVTENMIRGLGLPYASALLDFACPSSREEKDTSLL